MFADHHHRPHRRSPRSVVLPGNVSLSIES
jgi:hypothetical protein